MLIAGALQNAILTSAQFLDHRDRREGHHPALQRRRRAHAGLSGRGGGQQDQPERHPRSAGGDGARPGLEPRARHPIAPGFEALAFKASREIEDNYELTYICKDGSRFPAVVSITALRDEDGGIIGYLLIGTDNTVRKRVEES